MGHFKEGLACINKQDLYEKRKETLSPPQWNRYQMVRQRFTRRLENREIDHLQSLIARIREFQNALEEIKLINQSMRKRIENILEKSNKNVLP